MFKKSTFSKYICTRIIFYNYLQRFRGINKHEKSYVYTVSYKMLIVVLGFPIFISYVELGYGMYIVLFEVWHPEISILKGAYHVRTSDLPSDLHNYYYKPQVK